METDSPADEHENDRREEDDSTESVLESLLVDDAEVRWDPTTGKPEVTRRQKSGLDRPARSE
jgi:hypothetical protein